MSHSFDRNSLRLYLVTDRELALGRKLEDVVTEAVKGGVTMVQLREKTIETKEFVELAIRLKGCLKNLGIPLIINDRVDVALASDADGVHLGQSDMPYPIARKLLGPDKIIGLSVENMDEVMEAEKLDVDYIGISPVYNTPTKTDTAPAFGQDGLKKAVSLSRHPAVGIGGMNLRTAADTIRNGAEGIAVVSAIMSARNPEKASKELIEEMKNTKIDWSRRIWSATRKIYDAILDEAFIRELADGTLPQEKFARYIAQDEVYIGNYGRQMFQLAELMMDTSEKELFKAFAQSGLDGEKAMHDLLINRFGIDTEVTSSEVTSFYNAHTQRAIDSGSREIGLAAMLPCMWIYNRVGLHILAIAELEGNPYREWIEEYGNEEFTEGVNTVVSMIDKWAESADEDTLKAMDNAYSEAALCEYAFWDYGYEGEGKDYSYMKRIEGWI